MCSGYLPTGAEDSLSNPSGWHSGQDAASFLRRLPTAMRRPKVCHVCGVEPQEDESIFCFDCHDKGRAMQRERMAALVMGMAVPKSDHAE